MSDDFRVNNPAELKAKIGSYKALIGLDLGSKTIGVAVSDLLLTAANPIITIQRTSFAKDIAELKRIIKEKEVAGMVYGFPLQMNGEIGERAQETIKFAEKVTKEIKLPYLLWDERLSSSAVERIMIKDADLSRSKRKKNIDRAAASFILQGVLDSISYL